MSESEIDYRLLGAQIRAARALLGWSQAQMIEVTKCGRSTLIDLEAGRRIPHEATMFVIRSTLAAAGVEFIDNGVRLREWPPRDHVKERLERAKLTPRDFKDLQSIREFNDKKLAG